ncbi:uncharacterized protein LOC100915730 [Sarcophilus harrisii]|uniref:uncharacterized protein LOC100915730 n=1 Tax=Sarcophilus harrisii TaxID=9305 RepID=UPI0002739410|nr:uncharacterized protein LOC100915730 [Sarcophilus harrisii]
MEVMGGQAPAGAGGLAAVNMGPEALILAVAVAGAGGGPSPTTAGSGSNPEADTWTWTWTWKGEWSGQDIALGPTLAALLLLYAALWASVVELRWRVLDLAQQQEEEPDPETGTEERAETRTEAEAGAEAKQVLERESEQELKHKAETVPEKETEPEAEAEADADEELEELQEPSSAWDSKKPTSLWEIGLRTNVPVRGMSARPVGVAGVVVAVRSGLVLKLMTLDARAGSLLPARSQQVILDQGSIRSLRPLGLDLVHINNGRFFPLLGAFQEHLLNLLEQEASRARTNILVLLDTKILKKIYHQVSNAYKMDGDTKMSGLSLQQLLEILLSCKKITTTYIKRNNIAITVEGEDACLFNSNAMYGVNLGLRDLESKEGLATNKATAGDCRDVFQPLSANTKQSREIEESKSERLFGAPSE